MDELLISFVSIGNYEVLNLIINYVTKLLKTNNEIYFRIIKSGIIKSICLIFDNDLFESINNFTIKLCFKFFFYCFTVNEFLLIKQNITFGIEFLTEIIKLGSALFSGYSTARIKSDIYIIKTVGVILMNYKHQQLMDFCLSFDLFNKILNFLTKNPSKYLLFEIQQLLGRIFLYNDRSIQVRK